MWLEGLGLHFAVFSLRPLHDRSRVPDLEPGEANVCDLVAAVAPEP